MAAMNRQRQSLMSAPSLHSQMCVVCGLRLTSGPHHVVPRSAGGHDGPTLPLCGTGTTGCHGKAEARLLRFEWEGYEVGWTWRETNTRGEVIAHGTCRVTDEYA